MSMIKLAKLNRELIYISSLSLDQAVVFQIIASDNHKYYMVDVLRSSLVQKTRSYNITKWRASYNKYFDMPVRSREIQTIWKSIKNKI